MKLKQFVLIVFTGLFICALPVRLVAGQTIALHIESDLDNPALHGLNKLEEALKARGHSVTYSEDVVSGPADLFILAGKAASEGPASNMLKVLNVPLPDGPEALAIRRTEILGKPALVLCGSDDVGLMYAALDVADRISWTVNEQDPLTHIQDISENPYVLERAVSIYTMQRVHFERFLFDETKLESYFDMLAANRINSFVMVLGYENGGFMAPAYPYFYDVAEFPDVTLEGISPEQQAKNTSALKKMIQLAHDRGIRFSPAFWDHIYRGAVQSGGIPGASENTEKPMPHLVWGVTTENLVDYNKAALLKFMQVFPEIDAIQFRMHWESGLTRQETPAFWHDMLSIIQHARPDLLIDLRAKGLPDVVIEDAISMGLNFRVTTKYWMEQMGLPFHPTHINKQNQGDRRHGYADLLRLPKRYPVHWRMWSGGSTRFLLWGDPDYVRRFAESTKIHQGNSFEINEMLATKMLAEDHDAQPFELLNPEYQYYEYEFERYWHFYQVWGRVSYNPGTSADIWEHEFYSRFGKESGAALMNGLHLASQVLPRIVAASYLYKSFPTTRGWPEMMREEDLPVYATAEGSDIQQFMNMADYAQSLINGTNTAMRQPVRTSEWFNSISGQILEKVSLAEESIKKDIPGKDNNEFISTTTDLKILAFLAGYHSRRLLAGVQYNLYTQTGNLFAFDRAIELEQEAIDSWAGIITAAGSVYSNYLAFGVHELGFSHHWSEQLEELESGLEQLKADRMNIRPEPEEDELRIAHLPVRQLKPSESLRIKATIISRHEIKKADVLIENDGRYKPVHMKPLAEGMYEIIVPVAEGETSLNYIIEARDSHGNKMVFPEAEEAEPIHVYVSDDEKVPDVRLERIKRATPGRNLSVSARVSDPSGLKWVRLRYRHLTQFEDYQSLEMELDPQSGLYQAIIPGDFIVPEWNLMYFVEAVDSLGNGIMIPDLEIEMPYVIVEIL